LDVTEWADSYPREAEVHPPAIAVAELWPWLLFAGALSDAPVHARPALATAHELIERGVIREDELRARMGAVRERFGA
jgi:hypothetical protein